MANAEDAAAAALRDGVGTGLADSYTVSSVSALAGNAVIVSTAGVAVCLLIVRLGSSICSATVDKGVPSTGQKLNLSANCSSHLEQNFIETTSSPLWGSSTDSGSLSAPKNSLLKPVSYTHL